MQKSEHTEWKREREREIENHTDILVEEKSRQVAILCQSLLPQLVHLVWVTFVYIFKSILIFNSCIANSISLFSPLFFHLYKIPPPEHEMYFPLLWAQMPQHISSICAFIRYTSYTHEYVQSERLVFYGCIKFSV